MLTRNKVLLFLHEKFGNFYHFNFIVLIFYRNILVPLIKLYLKASFSNLIDVRYRNSLCTPRLFNAFVSDIDIDLIIEDNSDYQALLKSYLDIKSFFIMLDYPEIYFQSEYVQLQKIKKDHADLINLTWNIRKINWNLDSLESSPDELNRIKKIRSLKKSFSIILKNKKSNQANIYNLEDFKVFSDFVPRDDSPKTLCYWSFFLETNKKNHIKLLATASQFPYLNALMPGEDIPQNLRSNLSNEYLSNKAALEFYELQLSKSSMRLSLSQSRGTAELKKWIDYLEKRSGVTEVKE